jgi:hypothetical protein
MISGVFSGSDLFLTLLGRVGAGALDRALE